MSGARLTCLRGGRVHDPVHGVDGEVRDLWLRGGRLVEPAPGEPADTTIALSGCIVMAGGIDLHTHIGGGKMNLARLLLPELQRHADGDPCRHVAPGAIETGWRYVEMGYTAAFEPAMVAANARQTHMELGDTPVLDHGAYVMLGNDEMLLRRLAEGAGPEEIRDLIAWTLHATKAMGVKVVNPAGISAFKFDQRRLDVDEPHRHWQVTPRQVLQSLAQGLQALGVPHPLHIHASNLGVAGNIDSTLATIDALEGLPAHLTHVQFHAYGREGPKKFSSAARALVEALDARPQLSVDVGQILFGQTVTASGDTMRQFANAGLASPRKSVFSDIECEAGCGVVPFRYRESSFVNALQWAIGLEIFLQAKDPWQVVLTTDHPNGGPFTSYPHLIRLLCDRDFRNAQLARLHPEVAQQCALKDIRRELTLQEVAIMTRAGPARLLGLRDRGHLGAGAVADIAVYRDDPLDRERMFTTPEWVFKDGAVVARQGRRATEPGQEPVGGTFFVVPDIDPDIGRALRRRHARWGTVNPDHLEIGCDELCACGRGGRLLPVECFAGREGGTA